MGLIIKNGVIYNGAESEPVVYSLDEREVGVWIDGKPLYQKTWDFGSNLSVSYSSWTASPIPKDGFDTIVQCVNGLIGNQQACWGVLSTSLEVNNTYIALLCGRHGDNCNVRYLTLQYTKTADTPGSGTWTPSGVKSEHYSTNEHVVGTWIDGSTIYEKTLVIEPPFTSDMTITHNITNINRVIESKSFIDCGNGSSEIFNDPPINGNAFDWIIRNNDFTRTNFSIKIGSSRLPYTVGIYITIRYTKLS